MFISEAFAQTVDTANQVAAAPAPDAFKLILQFVLIIFVLYFLLIRPQQKKIKAHEQSLNSIVKGSKVVVSGIVGKVVGISSDNERLTVEIADKVEITVLRAYVSQVIEA